MRKRLTAFVQIYLIIIISLWEHDSRAADMSPQADRIYASLDTIDSPGLVEAGREAITAGDNERAAMALSMVTWRYQANPTDTLQRRCAVIAYRNLGNLYTTHSLDYHKAYRNLHTALKIAEQDHDDFQLAYIHTSLGNLYYSNLLSYPQLNVENRHHMIEGTEAALRSHNERALGTLGANVAFYAVTNDSLEVYMPLLERVAEYPYYTEANRERTEGTLKIIEGCRKWIEGDSAHAETLLREALELNASHPLAERYRRMVYTMLSYLHARGANYPKAISLLRSNLTEAEQGNYKDMEITLYKRLAELYRQIGNNDSANLYYDRYLWLKDTLTNTAGYGAVPNLDFMAEIERMNVRMDNVNALYFEQRRRTLIVVSVSIVLAVILLSLLWIYRNLKRNHRILYERLQDTLRREQQLQLLRQQLEEERRTWQSMENPSAENMTETGKTERPEQDNETVPDKELMPVYARIISYMDTANDLYQPGFSLNDLSVALGVSRQTVSKAINVCHGSNFPQLLNEYRLREVMRLMDDTANSGLTIESIAEQAGFKSRTSFTALFKSRTGLTPAAYLRMSRSRNS